MRAFLRSCCVVLLTLCAILGLPSVKGAYGKESETTYETAETVASGDRVTRFLVLGRDRAAGLTDSIFVVAINETENGQAFCRSRATPTQIIPKTTIKSSTAH